MRHIFIISAILVHLYGCTSSAEEKPSFSNKQEQTQPNIIFLLADDLGYGDLSCYGSQSIETPNIDALACRGMRFTQFYAGSAVCSPSRASLLTGKFPLRFNVRQHFRDSTDHLSSEAVTIPKLLKQVGYETCHIGKWHLGGLRLSDLERRNNNRPALPGPMQQGFNHYLTNIEGKPIRPRLVKQRLLYREGGKTLIRNDQRIPAIDKHWTEIKIDEAITWLDEVSGKGSPFFLNLWFDVPHTPYEPAPEPHLSKYKALGIEGDQLFFRSMVSHLDAQIGRLMEYLTSKGLDENTIIVFTSDNGPAYQGSPGPFKGGKTDLHEGGIRVPMFAVWPNKIPAKSRSFQIMHMVDLLPTLAPLAGFTAPKDADGIDMITVLNGETPLLEERPPLLWQLDYLRHYQNQGEKPKPYSNTVARLGNWKLLADSLTPVELFNLGQDHREIYNLLGEQDTVENELRQHIETFHKAPRVFWEESLSEKY